jgi:hypothetical protein
MKHVDKRIRKGLPLPQHIKDISFVSSPSSHHYPKGYPKSFSDLYSSSLSAHSILDSNIGKKAGT